MIKKCREHQLWSDEAPPGVAVSSWMEGYVDLKYGNLRGEANGGAPYFLKLLAERVETYEPPLAAWDAATFGDFD